MSTYLNGVNDYIPQFQPFSPDLNIYNTTMQTLQSRYDSGYKALNKVYGQFLYAPLTKEENENTREDILKQIDFNIKRISTLDLSLEQNVNQAVQVFKPFYENKFIMKDMAFTKNYQAQKSRGEGLKNSLDTERRKEYWDAGIRALDYKREEFKNSSLEESLNFSDVSYTPYVNTMEKALQIAKDAELNIESVKFSPDGKYIIKTKNGEQLTEPLQRLFESQLGSDPAIQDVYKTQAYVNRKDYAYSNAGLFGGDTEKAEMKYLEDNFQVLKQQAQKQYSQIEQENQVYSNKIKVLEERVKNKQGGPQAQQALEELKYNKSINDSVLARVKKDNEMLSDVNSTGTTSSFNNPYGDIQTLRYKVDQGITNNLLAKDLGEAAQIFAFRNSSVDIKADEYALNKDEHKYRMAEIATKAANDRKLQALKNQDDLSLAYKKDMLAKGLASINPDGSIELVADNVNTRPSDSGATGETNLKNISRESSKRYSENLANGYMTDMLSMLQDAKDKGLVTDKEIKNILQVKGQGYSIEAFAERMRNNPEGFLRNTLGEQGISSLHKKFGDLSKTNKAFEEFTGTPDFQNRALEVKKYTEVIEADKKWRVNTSKLVEEELYKKGFKYVKFLYDNNGNLRSEKEFNRLANEARRKNNNPRNNSNILDWGKITLSPSGAMPLNSSYNDTGYKSEYSRLLEEAGKVYSNSNLFKQKQISAPIGVIEMENGTGLFTNESYVVANPGAPHRKSTMHASQTLDFLNNSDLGDTDTFQFSFTGKGRDDLSSAKKDPNTQLGKALISELMREFQNTKSKMGNLEFATQSIVGGSTSTSAATFRPSLEWLKARVGTDDKPNLLTAKQFQKISKNGITVFMPKETAISNIPMVKNSVANPIESIVQQNGSFTYDNPWSVGQFSIKPDNLRGGYNINYSTPRYDAETGKIIESSKETANVPDLTNIDAVLQNYNEQNYLFNQQLKQY